MSNIKAIKEYIRYCRFKIKKNTASLIFGSLPIQNNKIVVDNFIGKGYGDNPKYIVEELLKANRGYDIVWVVGQNTDDKFPAGIRTVKYGSFSALYEYATAHLWIDNVRNSLRPKKKKQQIYLQTWHGSFPVKPIEGDAEKTLSKWYIVLAKDDGKITDAIVSGSKEQIDIFQRAFWLNSNTEYLKYGVPRTDILFKSMSEPSFRNQIKDELGVRKGSPIILYAPTFRDNYSTNGYIKDAEKVVQTFCDKFGEECTLVIRMHPNAKAHIDFYHYSDRIINGTDYPDMQKLCIAADWLITDYSSCVYDVTLLNKPVFIYANDYEEYIKIRGMSKAFNDWVFPKAFSFTELIDNIKKFDETDYDQKISEYLRERPLYGNGNASKKIADWIIEKMEGK